MQTDTYKYDGHRSTSGFSMIELAVVLVIIGLIVGGIVGGQQLIKSAEVRSVIADVESFSTGVSLFEQQYLALPGDFQTATSYWAATANGDGDGIIEWTNESLRAWQQLGLAGMVPGSYTGTGTAATPGTNVPESPMGGGYTLHDGGEVKTDHSITTGIPAIKNYVLLGQTTAGKTIGPLLIPEVAFEIDRKMDDGNPQSGVVLAQTLTNCLATGNTAYDLTQTAPRCVLDFRLP